MKKRSIYNCLQTKDLSISNYDFVVCSLLRSNEYIVKKRIIKLSPIDDWVAEDLKAQG